MTGKQLFDNYTSKRDYSGSTQDEYAQMLSTIQLVIGDAIYPLLEKAEAENKKLFVKTDNETPFAPQLTKEDIVMV